MSLALFAQAQLSISYNGQTLNNGDTLFLNVDEENDIVFAPTFYNSGHIALNCRFEAEDIVAPQSVVASMCTGIVCKTGYQSGEFTIEAESSYTDGHAEFYFPYENPSCLLKFSVYAVSDPSVKSHIYLQVGELLAIHDAGVTALLKAYPNPATNVLTVETAETEGSVVIYNIMGDKVSTIDLDGRNSIQVDVSALPSGIYLYGVRSSNGQSAMKKFVKK